ncbi:MAG: cytochrome c biogenesis protein CcdA [Anaerolineae bacterium]|nr:cytochrome c biogenesis protein CcdA [Anaerolineae bacterium]
MTQQIAATNTAVRSYNRLATFVQGVFFVAGFGAFIIGFLGLASTALGDLFFDLRPAFSLIGGVALILFGLFTLRIINIPLLYSDTRRQINPAASKGVSAAQSFITGLAFAAGWTPCIGPFLGAILTLSVTSELGVRLLLLSAYTLGLGIPFLIVALLADRMTPVLAKLKRNMRFVEIISGLLLIGIGVLLVTGQMLEVTRILAATSFSPEEAVLGPGSGAAPTIFVAMLAGFLSFASPCVLPLIPAYLGFIGGWAVNNADRPA